MFVDETGLLKGLRLNLRATRMYMNNSLREEPGAQYTVVTQPPEVYDTDLEFPFHILRSRIHGEAFLWTGDMR